MLGVAATRGFGATMRPLEKIKADLYAEIEEHSFSATSGHRYNMVADNVRRIAAVKELGEILVSASTREAGIITTLLVEFIRNATRFRRPRHYIRFPSRREIIRPFCLSAQERIKQPRTRSVLHRLRFHWLHDIPLPPKDIALAIRLLKNPSVQGFVGTSAEPLKLDCAELDMADLRGAMLSGFSISDASMVGAHLFRAVLSKADSQRVRFFGADLQFSYLDQSNLHWTTFKLANLRQANLDRALLLNAKLDFAYLGQASLIGANLQSAKIDCANLSAADLSHAEGLTQDQLSEAFGCAETILPSKFADWRPAHWYPDSIPTHRRRNVVYFEWLAHRESGNMPPWFTGVE